MFKKFLLTALIISPNIAFTTDQEVKESMSVYEKDLVNCSKAMLALILKVKSLSKDKKNKFDALFEEIIKSNKITALIVNTFRTADINVVEKSEEELLNIKKKLITLDKSIKQEVENFFESIEKATKSNLALSNTLQNKLVELIS